MKIDNSQAETWASCPALYQEKYLCNWSRLTPWDSRHFGSRVHSLLESHFLQQAIDSEPLQDSTLEAEAQELYEGYLAQYPVEDFTVIATEPYFEVPLPDSDHILIGKMDLIVRSNTSGRLSIMDHKTESRSSKANLPEVWAAKPQVGLYQWAGERLYHEPFDSIILDILTRRSPAGRIGPSYRRDTLQRSAANQMAAVKNIIWIADQITRMKVEFPTGMWPQFRGNCNKGGWKCDFFLPHVTGEVMTDELLPVIRDHHFEKAEPYLPEHK